MPSEEHGFIIIRGRAIGEFTREELLALHDQIDNELPDDLDKLTGADVNKLHELELIEDELDKR